MEGGGDSRFIWVTQTARAPTKRPSGFLVPQLAIEALFTFTGCSLGVIGVVTAGSCYRATPVKASLLPLWESGNSNNRINCGRNCVSVVFCLNRSGWSRR